MYPHQTERLTEALARDGLAAVVATAAANLFYMTDFESRVPAQRFALWTPRGTALVVPADDVPQVVSDSIDVDHLGCFGDAALALAGTRSSDEARIREVTGRAAPSSASAVAAALDALGVSHGRIGLDETAGWDGLAGFTVVPAAATLRAARRVKSPYEIECLARSLGIAEEALNAVIQKLEPGITEREAAALYEREVRARNALPSAPSLAFGERTSTSPAPPTDRALAMGDLVRFDVGAVFKGYRSSVARTAVMGEPTERHAAVMEAVENGVGAGVDAVKPGVTGGRVYDLVMGATRAAGLADFRPGQVGHAIGLDAVEPPDLAPGDPTTLEAGEVLCIEVPHFEVGWGGVALRDTVLVTTTGSRVLNRSVRGLIVLD